ncbi:MAG TPA: glycoside hydrolase family 9 protein [Vicinamibacterales bacterium]|nr:glycoside hydrolase family 9 protein [Vicinamibacterales bacterium]
MRANQLGYLPGDTKTAMAFSNTDLPSSFEVVNGDGRVVMHGPVRRVVPEAWGSFAAHAELDFSELRTSGTYRVRLSGSDVESHPFTIGPNVFADAADAMLGFMRAQRCGYNPYLDSVCHRFDGRTADGPRPAGSFIRADGGWHDAGDTLKYLITASNATAQLLLAYQLNPAIWKDRSDEMGRSQPNGRADVLDEARWGLEWLLRLHPSPRELYHMVGDDRDHSGWRLPQDDQSDYGWGKGSYRVVYFASGKPQGLGRYRSESTGVANIAGRYAAAMALAYQIWKDAPRERPFALECLRAAREVYALGREKEGVQQGNSYGSPYRYNENTWADDMEWGAAELYRATGESAFLVDARRYARLIGATSWMGRDAALHYEFYPFMNAGHFRLGAHADDYKSGLEAALASGRRNPWQIGVPFIWCSNNLVVALATQGLMFERMTGSRAYYAFTTRQRDWLFGTNPWGTSMFTGLGTVSPSDVHIPSIQIKKQMVAGGLVDGPVQESIFSSLKGVTLSRPDAFTAFQSREAVYHDDWQDYATNEPTMDGTASAVLLMALQRAPNAASRRER